MYTKSQSQFLAADYSMHLARDNVSSSEFSSPAFIPDSSSPAISSAKHFPDFSCSAFSTPYILPDQEECRGWKLPIVPDKVSRGEPLDWSIVLGTFHTKED